MTASSSKQFDVYSAITSQIITAIESGAGPVQLPWHRAGACVTRPVNVSSGNTYRGVNVVALWAAAITREFPQGLWGTYRQWQECGGQVRKGESSSLIIFYKDLPGEDESGEDSAARRYVVKASRVFNVAQVDGYQPEQIDPDSNPVDPIVRADEFVVSSGAMIREGGDRAFYRMSEDVIHMPDQHRFTGTTTSTVTQGWYATLLHELTHWSGASHRLDRQFGERFGDDAYAMEELVAELGAAFLCADLGVTLEPRADHAAYIDHWLRILKSDRKAIFAAASAASKAADYLYSMNSDREIDCMSGSST